eukprot:TRINITY_DN12621_c0_g1_i1.p1 TRINITY_DN12621_c0_g1~~TRINITY_DN12621_c0_g1_i1.p1  ORF type:complete len:249 (+),score=26.60 TRINITY_DN12621_c0_g1_i1:95-748(+)
MRLLILSVLLGVALAATGVDVSQLVSVSTFNCLKSSGFGDFVVARGYQEGGYPDPNVCSTIANARSAGIPYHDVYLFPCVQCGNGAGQLTDLYNHLLGCGFDYKNGAFGMVWLDIESGGWYSSTSSNQNFFNELVQGCKSVPLVCGVYTNANEWSSLMGSSFCGGANAGLPLWWAYWDGLQNMNAWKPFACWNSANVKQYYGDKTVCSFDVDEDWYA